MRHHFSFFHSALCHSKFANLLSPFTGKTFVKTKHFICLLFSRNIFELIDCELPIFYTVYLFLFLVILKCTMQIGQQNDVKSLVYFIGVKLESEKVKVFINMLFVVFRCSKPVKKDTRISQKVREISRVQKRLFSRNFC